MTDRARYSPKIKKPTFTQVTIGDWIWRLAVAADVSAGDARTVGDLIREHTTDGVYDASEADV